MRRSVGELPQRSADQNGPIEDRAIPPATGAPEGRREDSPGHQPSVNVYKDLSVPEGRLRIAAPDLRRISRPSGTPSPSLRIQPTDKSVGYCHRAPPGRRLGAFAVRDGLVAAQIGLVCPAQTQIPFNCPVHDLPESQSTQVAAS